MCTGEEVFPFRRRTRKGAVLRGESGDIKERGLNYLEPEQSN